VRRSRPYCVGVTGSEPPASGGLEARGDRVAPGQLRASHQDRDRVVELLRVAAGDGRLTPEELDERLESALTARTYAELAALTTDLPAASSPHPGVDTPPPKEMIRIDCGTGRATREGRWVVPRRMEIKVHSGEVKLDLTDAVISAATLRIDADVYTGRLKLITKPGIAVDTDEVGVHSGEVKVRAPWGPDVPVTLRIEVAGHVHSGQIVTRPPRRGFWAWLTRQPPPWATSRPAIGP
jgi:Domain of unknown function (DUF1707)